ncbi:MAG: N-acetyltransferase family protein [Planctomycetes bacterium]|nr:N-acetyltransferase family protein [Planctomycetota bacterium]
MNAQEFELRFAAPADAAGIAAIYAPIVRDTPISFETEPPAPAEMERRLRDGIASFPWLVCARGGEIAGYAYAGEHRKRAAYRWSVEVSIYIAAARRRAGIGRALYAALLRGLAAQGYVNAYAGITLPNPASVALHETLDFRPVGIYREVGYKDGRWHDVGWWQRALGARPAAPPEPLPFASARGGAAWSQALAAGTALLEARKSN